MFVNSLIEITSHERSFIMKYTKLIAASLLSAGLLAVATSSQAASQTGSFNVKLAVAPMCVLGSTTDIDFGSVNLASLPANDLQQTTSLSVTCNTGTAYTISLSPSNGSTDGAGLLTNIASGSTIPYALFQDTGVSIPWGNQIGTNTVAFTSAGATDQYTVHVVVSKTAITSHLAAGDFNDVVSVAVNY